jgi:hypothetical protein
MCECRLIHSQRLIWLMYYNITVILSVFCLKKLCFSSRRGGEGKGLPGTPIMWHVYSLWYVTSHKLWTILKKHLVPGRCSHSGHGVVPVAYVDIWHTCLTVTVTLWPWLASRLFRQKKRPFANCSKNDPSCVQLWPHVTFFYGKGMVDSRRLKKMKNETKSRFYFVESYFFWKIKKMKKSEQKNRQPPF